MYQTNEQLGIVEPYTTALAIDYVMSLWDRKKVQALVPDFPRVFNQAVIDFAKLKEGAKRNLFTQTQLADAMRWFDKFPDLWEAIRLNFIKTDAGREFGGRVDDFIGSIKRSGLPGRSLGLAPVLVAGVLIVGGAAAGLWAIAYMKKQANISRMIDGVTKGAIPANVLVEAVKAEQGVGLFGGLASAIGPLALVAAAYVVHKFIAGKR